MVEQLFPAHSVLLLFSQTFHNEADQQWLYILFLKFFSDQFIFNCIGSIVLVVALLLNGIASDQKFEEHHSDRENVNLVTHQSVSCWTLLWSSMRDCAIIDCIVFFLQNLR